MVAGLFRRSVPVLDTVNRRIMPLSAIGLIGAAGGIDCVRAARRAGDLKADKEAPLAICETTFIEAVSITDSE